MNPTIKGGLIGIVIGIICLFLGGISILMLIGSFGGWGAENQGNMGIVSFIIYFILFFIIGSVISWIINKLYSFLNRIIR